MQSSLKKSLYLGLAALSFAGVAAVSTTASAKSYAKAGAYTTLSSKAETRNVEATGSNALYTKPGTVKGAKVVASVKTMKTLASSKKSADYFRAYGVKTTNRGSVYYRVVSMNGKYRGYIYGGKSDTAFAGGIKSAETTTKAALPTNKTVYFANPGTTNVTWTAPKYTQYKASKNVLNTTPFAGDTLTITDAATKTREGSLYYYVKDAQHPSVSGWIYSKAVTSDASVAYNQATDVKVNFVATDGSVVKSTTLTKLHANDNKTNAASTTELANAKGTAVGFDVKAQATDPWGKTALTGTGYEYHAELAANQSALLAAKTGDVVSLNVTKGDQAVQSINAYTQKGTGKPVKLTKAPDKLTTLTANWATTVTFPTLSAAFAGANGANYTATDVANFLTTNKANKLVSVDYAKAAGGTIVATTDKKALGTDGKPANRTNPVQVWHTEYTLTSGVAGTYTTGGTASAFYNTVNEVKGSGVATDNSGSNSVFA